MIDWQPTADITTLKHRAEIVEKIRHFFRERYVIEVETPVLSKHTVTDVHLHSLSTIYPDNKEKYYFQTSPEYHMKRLLAAGSGSIFQICKSFRVDESGRLHNPEFTMLEWYRINFDHHQLMDEIAQLLNVILLVETVERYTYQQIFQDYLQCDPLMASVDDLKDLRKQYSLNTPELGDDKDAWLMLLFSHLIEPQLQKPTFIYDFPASQAALAKLNKRDKRVADRFELYIDGMEIANGFNELSNVREQRSRFKQDQKKRKSMGYEAIEIDERFLSALSEGFPSCSGVALGVDRLVMLALKKNHINEVITFPFESA
jgi:lysyl-tRNA synthetase class 2